MEAQEIYKLSQYLYIAELKNKKKEKGLFENLRLSELYELEDSKELHKKLKETTQYLQNNLINAKNKQTEANENYHQVHIILESSLNSEIIFSKFMEKAVSAVEEMNRQNKVQANAKQKLHQQDLFKITQITGSNFNALAMFLICIDLPKDMLEKKIKEIKDCLEVDDEMIKNFDSNDWLECDE